jgi:hypothetical protein
MNLVEALAREHSRAQCQRIVRYIGHNPRRFAGLVKVFLAGPYRLTQRAGWPLSYCVRHSPDLVKPHLRKIIENLDKPGLHDAVKRNTVRLLQFIDIPDKMLGVTANACFRLFGNAKEPIAVRVFAMTVLTQIALRQAGLKDELIVMIEDQLPHASPGFLSRATRLLKQLKD